MPLEELQKLVGEEAQVNEVLISHRGQAVEGGRYPDKTLDEMESILSSNDLQADPVKKDAVEDADRLGERFSTLFVLFGQFSVAAGMLLIFLIFVMLAAERKHELRYSPRGGDAAFPPRLRLRLRGALYALIASSLGSVAGVG